MIGPILRFPQIALILPQHRVRILGLPPSFFSRYLRGALA
jgi:hypothetical protein